MVLLLLLALVCAGAGGYWYQTRGAAQRTPPPTEQEIAQKVELLTMRNVRQYYVDNDKVGKVFVIEGRVVNEFPQPKELVTVEAAIYDKDKKPLSVKRQIAGAQLSLFQLQVLSEKEMEAFLTNKVEILTNNATCPGGEVPFMVLFYAPPEGVAEFGVRIVDVQDAPAPAAAGGDKQRPPSDAPQPQFFMKTDTPHLKRALKNRHIQLIALGGAIGTGLFLGSAGTIQMAGPAVLLSYAVGGFIAFLIMRQLGEMMAQEPVAGSFSNLAHKYWGDFPGLLSGWNYWILYVLVGMSELTAVAVYVQYWFPQVEPWQTTAFFFLCINAINLAQVGFFGEMEFWFAVIKVVAIVLMIALGCFLLASGQAGPEAGLSNLWTHGGFFPQWLGRGGHFFGCGGLFLWRVGTGGHCRRHGQRARPSPRQSISSFIAFFFFTSVRWPCS